MPRTARKKSGSGIYHIMLRGINRQTIFTDDEDCEKFLQVLEDVKAISRFELYAYCLMGNHVHLLIRVMDESIEQIMKRVGVRFVTWYNCKYKRDGHLFQDRFKSEAVETDDYFITVLRYIHQNPVKAKLCQRPEEYPWSSYRCYLLLPGIVDVQFGLDLIGVDFQTVMNQANEDVCLDLTPPPVRLTDNELRAEIEKHYKIDAQTVHKEQRERQTEILRALLQVEGVSTRQLSRVTGVSVHLIWRL